MAVGARWHPGRLQLALTPPERSEAARPGRGSPGEFARPPASGRVAVSWAHAAAVASASPAPVGPPGQRPSRLRPWWWRRSPGWTPPVVDLGPAGRAHPRRQPRGPVPVLVEQGPHLQRVPSQGRRRRRGRGHGRQQQRRHQRRARRRQQVLHHRPGRRRHPRRGREAPHATAGSRSATRRPNPASCRRSCPTSS